MLPCRKQAISLPLIKASTTFKGVGGMAPAVYVGTFENHMLSIQAVGDRFGYVERIDSY